MVNRMKPILERLVSREQSSFVPGRQITDNIVLYQEVLHSLRTNKTQKNYMMIKIYLEKAYDRLRWDFIEDTLREAGFGDTWVRNIMGCVTSAHLALLWNGQRQEWFYPKRGIRQGDALSPYLFVLCVDRLTHLIKHLAEEGKWKGIKLSRRGPTLTHLFFADDLVLLAEASVDQMQEIRRCLDFFCKVSGQRVSLNKSEIFFSSNVPREDIESILEVAGMPRTLNLGRYLGVPSIHGRVTKSMFGPLLERINTRLEGWRANYLTLAGIIILAKSVLSTIPYFAMQSMLLPDGVCDAIDKRIRSFIWGTTRNQRRCHLVSWETVVKTKDEGGLGIRSMREMNKAFLAKLA